MEKRIFLSPPHMGGDEIRFVQEAFETNWISPAGPHIDQFEKELAAYNQVPHCAALSSGTAAIHLALIILGIKQYDEVICSSFTFSGSCNPIVYQGAVPVFVDANRETWNMDPVLLEEAIVDRQKKGRKPKAIIVVHLYGMPAMMNEIMQISRKYGIPVIEDAAEGLGARYKGQMLGSFGDIGIYSFNGNKIITTSGGGAMVSNREEWIQQARFLSTQARDNAPHYQHSSIGYNYRLSNVCAGIGRGQLKVLDERVIRRREIYQWYVERFNKYSSITFQPEADGSFANRWLTCILVQPEKKSTAGRETIRLALEKNNIESRPLWKPMHLQPVFADAPYYGKNVSDDLFLSGLCLPSGTRLLEEDLNRIAGIIEDLL